MRAVGYKSFVQASLAKHGTEIAAAKREFDEFKSDIMGVVKVLEDELRKTIADATDEKNTYEANTDRLKKSLNEQFKTQMLMTKQCKAVSAARDDAVRALADANEQAASVLDAAHRREIGMFTHNTCFGVVC
jgi:hypothetical protein